ncbi:hypothetical protein B0H67DRAFT_155655 [Lasiosphaeris hirsuta]|uniref:Uncharacterized protein n=1 Tax=Lasiosphaeris hirsuta TaxID=260670 RepID=A0AA40APC5_9PEZI|nr:hypothetical protein B0H67DRAFT_155655 [Lasiosphaeris hirsuta]
MPKPEQWIRNTKPNRGIETVSVDLWVWPLCGKCLLWSLGNSWGRSGGRAGRKFDVGGVGLTASCSCGRATLASHSRRRQFPTIFSACVVRTVQTPPPRAGLFFRLSPTFPGLVEGDAIRVG